MIDDWLTHAPPGFAREGQLIKRHCIAVIMEALNQPVGVVAIEHEPVRDNHVFEEGPTSIAACVGSWSRRSERMPRYEFWDRPKVATTSC